VVHAQAILFTVPGVPCVYYGDELAWRGTKEHRSGGDDAIRPPLPPVAEPISKDQAWVLDLHRQLIALRRARPWLTRADVEVLDVGTRHITYTVTAGANALLIALGVNGTPITPPSGWQPIAAHPGWVICERA
jgi:glycosidase